jgi:hypothetical protein
MKKNLFLLFLVCNYSTIGRLDADTLDPYAPKNGATWCQSPSSKLEENAQPSQSSKPKSGLMNKTVLVITSIALIAICVILGSSESASQAGPTT